MERSPRFVESRYKIMFGANEDRYIEGGVNGGIVTVIAGSSIATVCMAVDAVRGWWDFWCKYKELRAERARIMALYDNINPG